VTTRERMIASTALLVRERGARATSLDDVLAHSGAPRGSIYGHFPGGRAQLLQEATPYAGEVVARRIERAPRTEALLDGLVAGYREQLEATGFRAGCPVVVVAVEAGDPAVEQAAAAFARWQALIAARLRADGVSDADGLAALVLASIEGAIVLARAQRDPAPLDAVHRRLRALLRAEGSTP
jgi:AcrR family transcriptional regulator